VDVSTGNVTEFASATFGPGDPIQLAIESDGDLWAHGNGTLFQFDSAGAMVPFTLNGSDPSAVLGRPHANPGGIAFDNQGNLWVGDSPNAKITRIEPVIPGGPIASTATITLAVRGFNPTGIAVGLNGDIFAAHSADPPLEPGQILRITPSGNREVFVSLAGALFGIAVDLDGNIFASEDALSVGKRIVKVTPQGVASDYVTNISSTPGRLTVGSDGYLYALLPDEGKILQITGAETYTDFFTQLGAGSWSTSIAAAPSGGLYVANGQTGEVWYVPETGNSHTVVAYIPTLTGPPNAIAVTPAGDVFVQTHNNYHLWHITPGGVLQDYAADVFGDPYGLAISPDGSSVYVSRGGSVDRIPVVEQVFLPITLK
jgi:sugar lactone lactonase YvrE